MIYKLRLFFIIYVLQFGLVNSSPHNYSMDIDLNSDASFISYESYLEAELGFMEKINNRSHEECSIREIIKDLQENCAKLQSQMLPLNDCNGLLQEQISEFKKKISEYKSLSLATPDYGVLSDPAAFSLFTKVNYFHFRIISLISQGYGYNFYLEVQAFFNSLTRKELVFLGEIDHNGYSPSLNWKAFIGDRLRLVLRLWKVQKMLFDVTLASDIQVVLNNTTLVLRNLIFKSQRGSHFVFERLKTKGCRCQNYTDILTFDKDTIWFSCGHWAHSSCYEDQEFVFECSLKQCKEECFFCGENFVDQVSTCESYFHKKCLKNASSLGDSYCDDCWSNFEDHCQDIY